MHIGLIVGIGPAATDYYYRYLISALARAGQDLDLTMAHADTSTLLRNQSEGNVKAQVADLPSFDRKAAAGRHRTNRRHIDCRPFLQRCVQASIAGSRDRPAQRGARLV